MSDDDFNIFDAASEMSKSREERKRRRERFKKSRTPKPQPSEAQTPITPKKKLKTPRSASEYVRQDLPGYEDKKSDYQDVEEAYARVTKQHKMLRKQIEAVLQKARVGTKDIRASLGDRRKFSSEQWKVMEKVRKEEARKLWKALGKDAKKHQKRIRTLLAPEPAKQKKGLSTRRKGHRGKGGWMSMD